ncbi:MAG: glycosyltransferase family 4 protein [Chitinophagales bacterium]
MRIAQVLPYAEIGGTEKHCVSLCRELAARHEVVLLSPSGPALTDLDPRVTHLPFPRFDQNLLDGASTFVRLLRALKVDLVHVHAAAELVLLARLAARRRPLVFTVHGFHGRGAEASYRLARWAMRQSEATICVSAAERARLPGAVLVYNGVPDPGYRPTPGNGLVGFFGRLEPTKGVDVLLRSGVRPLLVVGDGSQRRTLEALAGDGATFTGFRPDAVRLMASCEVIAVPSLVEPFGLVAAEAAALGRPVVASAVGGLAEIVVDGETGYLVPPGDPVALGEALRRLQADPALARRLGEVARERYLAHFTLTGMVQAVERLYRSVVEFP